MDSTNERNSNVNGDNVMDCDDATISLIPNNEKIANNENIDNDQSSSAVHADQNDIESNIIDNIDVAVISKNGSKQQNDSTDDIGVDAPLMDTVPFEEDVVQSDDSALSLSIVSTYNDDAIASNSIDKQDTVNGGRKETAVRELDGAEEIPAKRQKISDDAVDTSSGSVISMPSSSLILHNDDDDNFNDNGRAKNDGIAAASDEGHDESVGCGNEAPKQPEISEAGEKLILTATEDDIADCNDDEGTVIRQRVVGNAAGQGYQENNTKFGPSSINVSLIQQQVTQVVTNPNVQQTVFNLFVTILVAIILIIIWFL